MRQHSKKRPSCGCGCTFPYDAREILLRSQEFKEWDQDILDMADRAVKAMDEPIDLEEWSRKMAEVMVSYPEEAEGKFWYD